VEKFGSVICKMANEEGSYPQLKYLIYLEIRPRSYGYSSH